MISYYKIDFRALAAFRIGLALLILADLVSRGCDLMAHYTDFGVLPREVVLKYFTETSSVSLDFIGGSTFFILFMFILTFLFALGMLLGVRSRISTVLSWLMLVSVHNRNPLVLQGGDILFRLLLFWAMFLPMGSRFSVDSALSKNKSTDKMFFSMATLGLLLQVALVYLTTVFHKSGKEWWPDGTASYYALMLDQFTTPLGKWVLHFGGLLRYFTLGVYALEGAAFFLLMVPTRIWQIRFYTSIALMVMHLSFGATMRLGLFPWIDLVSLIVFFPGPVWDWLEKNCVRKVQDIHIYFDGECAFCRKVVLILKTFLGLEVPVSEAQSDLRICDLMKQKNSWVVVKKEQTYFEFEAFKVLIRESQLWKWSANILEWPSISRLGAALYRLVAENRKPLALITRPFLNWREQESTPTRPLANAFLFLSIVAIVWWNATTLPQLKISYYPRFVRSIMISLRLDQMWNMFSPMPLKEDGWYVIPGELEDGTPVDVLKGKLEKVSWEKPEDFSVLYPGQRWHKYLSNLRQKKYGDMLLFYGRYLCRKWNHNRREGERLYKFQIHFMAEETKPDYQVSPITKVDLWRHRCFDKPEDKKT